MTADVTRPGCPQPAGGASCPTVTIVITTFNHARFLGDAIASALAQTHPAEAVIVVDDGSDDDPGAVVAQFAGVRLLRQANAGVSAARNAGLVACRSDMIVFLDADDRLLPDALQAGLDCHRRCGPCGMAYGGYRLIAQDGKRLSSDVHVAIGPDGHGSLLRGNLIGMHATVMYSRAALAQTGGFDVTLRHAEDYDLFLRLARDHPIASHPTTIAEYRKHGANSSSNHPEMLRRTLLVQTRAAAASPIPDAHRVWRQGQALWRAYYAGALLHDARLAVRAGHGPAVWSRALLRACWVSPGYVGRRAAGELLRLGTSVLRAPRAMPRVGMDRDS
jgi:glycosyltransferase involved in cell wall biosynthesis